jgi:radical SAM superfamily enzyme YgiQ (UPF0313 family)
MYNVYLYQPQYDLEINNQTNYWIPYSVGCIWSYASQFDDIRNNFTLKELGFKREKHEEICSRLENPKICGFSTYVWNREYNLGLAEKIKNMWPECIIVFGGPMVNESFLKKYSFIDCIILVEGEESFVKLCHSVIENVSYEKIYRESRIKNLDMPSPYLTGLFDNIVKENPDAVWAMTLETNRGCPYACTFCDWGGLNYSKIYKFSVDRVIAEFEWAANNNVGYIYVADANFGMFKDRDLDIARRVSNIVKNSCIESINVQYAKNSNETIFEIAKLFGKKSRGVTLSLQSLNDDTLIDIKRKNMEVNQIEKTLELSEKFGIGTYTEMILGLPNETVESWKDGLCNILEMGQHQSIEIWFANILENSELAQSNSIEKYGIKTIKALDYLALYNNIENEVYHEYMDIIVETNTMTTEELIESYLYGWLIINFHIHGYTQLYAKYLREIYKISYREIYDSFFKIIKKDKLFKSHYVKFKNILKDYLTTGKFISKEKIKGHALHMYSAEFVYNNREHVYNMFLKILKNNNAINEDISILQKNFVHDVNLNYPITIKNININTKTWILEKTNYKIESKFTDYKTRDFYSVRRSGVLKNILTIQ